MSLVTAISLSRSPASAFLVVGLFWGVFNTFVPEIKAGLNVGDFAFGVLTLGSPIGLVSAMWLAPRVDRWLGQWGMPLAALTMIAAFLNVSVALTPITFFISMIFVGIASGLTDVTMNARVSELEEVHSKSLMNANHGMFSLAYMCGALFSGFAREAELALWQATGMASVVVAVLVTQMRMPVQVHAEEHAHVARLPWKIVLICGAVVLVAFMSEGSVELWSALHVERTLDGRALEGALGLAMLGLTMAIGRFAGQVVAERLSEVDVIVRASALAGVGALIAAVAWAPWVAYVGFGILGLGISVIGPMGIALAGKLVPARFRTEAIAKAAVIGFAGFFVAPLMMGGISEISSLRWSFAAIAVLLALVLPLTVAIRRL